jgi:hypothetical protein
MEPAGNVAAPLTSLGMTQSAGEFTDLSFTNGVTPREYRAHG